MNIPKRTILALVISTASLGAFAQQHQVPAATGTAPAPAQGPMMGGGRPGMPMMQGGQGGMPMMGGPQRGMPMMQQRQGMPMMQGGMPMMQGKGGGMPMMQQMQAHRKLMEQRLENIQKLLEELVALQKQGAR